MGLGDFNFFIWKSKAQIQKEQEEYEKWAFPYGQPQREKLVKLMLEIFPKENEATVLIPFLTCKEFSVIWRRPRPCRRGHQKASDGHKDIKGH